MLDSITFWSSHERSIAPQKTQNCDIESGSFDRAMAWYKHHEVQPPKRTQKKKEVELLASRISPIELPVDASSPETDQRQQGNRISINLDERDGPAHPSPTCHAPTGQPPPPRTGSPASCISAGARPDSCPRRIGRCKQAQMLETERECGR